MNDIGSYSFVAAAIPAGDGSGSIGGLLLFISVALAVSFFCSMLEAGLLSTPSSYIETQAKNNPRATLWMQKAKENVDEPLTAILTLNTFAHTIGAAGAGAQAVGVFGNQWAAIITLILTILILVFSEIIPKTVGAVYWKQLYIFNAYSVRILSPIFYPLVVIFKRMMRAITPHEKSPTITRAEFAVMATIGSQEGSLAESEHRILKNLLHLDRVQVGDVMTPRTVMMAFDGETTINEAMADKKAIPYSRIPVYHENIDNVLGFVLRHDILQHAAEDQDDVQLKTLVREMYVILPTMPVIKVMDEFMQRKQHIFLVADDYGGTAGIISLEDVVESLLGVEITDESDIVADLRSLAQERVQRQRLLQEATGTSGYTSS